jgi:hypothetical protein
MLLHVCLQELASQKQLVQSLQEDKASLLQAQQHAEQQLTPRSSTAGAAADGASTPQLSPQASMQQLASPFAGQQDELASMAQQLAHSKKELQEALAAAAEMQQQARQLRLQLYSRCGCGQAASPACFCFSLHAYVPFVASGVDEQILTSTAVFCAAVFGVLTTGVRRSRSRFPVHRAPPAVTAAAVAAHLRVLLWRLLLVPVLHVALLLQQGVKQCWLLRTGTLLCG